MVAGSSSPSFQVNGEERRAGPSLPQQQQQHRASIRGRKFVSPSTSGAGTARNSSSDGGDDSSSTATTTMHRLADPDTRRMPIGGPPTPGEAQGPCGVVRRNAPALFAVLAVGLVALTIMTRHGAGGDSGGTGLPHLTGAGGAAGVRLNNPPVDKGTCGGGVVACDS